MAYCAANPTVPPAGMQLLIAKDALRTLRAWKYLSPFVVTK